MYIKIKGFLIKLSLLISLVIIGLGYGCLGNFIYAYRNYNPTIALSLLALSVAGIFALRLSLGGAIATFLSIIFLFVKSGTHAGIAALVVAIMTLWLGLQDSDRQNIDQPIQPLDWLSIAFTIIFTLTIAIAILQIFSGIVAGAVTGAIAASITIIGIQIKASEIPVKISLWLLAIAAGSGLIIGLVYGLLTQIPQITI